MEMRIIMDTEESDDYVDIPVEQQEFTFTFTTTEELNITDDETK
tara:strand:- start:542 stop:673 length:132 start_codon:yes stop_codon:yes gene_type:complete